MKVNVDTSGLRESTWYQYLVRFAFGGMVTALAGIIAKRFGPGIGGLFLAFPAILPASATLLEKHEKEKKERAGQQGAGRARQVAGVDAIGASMGTIGLALFAIIVWLRLPKSGTGMVLAGATAAWFIAAVSIWKIRDQPGIWSRRKHLQTPNQSSSAQIHKIANERGDDE